jgi:acyl-coenzyme A thioesterase PaaI-like protein
MVPRRRLDSTHLATKLLGPVPANESLGIEVLHAANASAEVCMLVPPGMTNVIGSSHSSGLIALIDATGRAALIAAATDEGQLEGVMTLGSVARVEFLGQAHGLLIGRCTVEVDDLASIEAVYEWRESTVQLATAVDVFDSSETMVCRGSFIWSVTRRGNGGPTRTAGLP